MPFIELLNVSRFVDNRYLVHDINLAIEKGEVFTLIGPTGAGKTTLLRLVDLLDVPTAGKILIGNKSVEGSSRVKLELRRRMAFVLQKPIVFNTSVYENVAHALRWRGIHGFQLQQKVDAVLETVRMREYRNRNARTLSGGEVQRVAIARAIALEPEVLLLDEPTANLDPLSAARVEELVVSIIQQRKTTILMSTHDRAQGQRLADRIGVMMNGGMVQVGRSQEIFGAPRSREVAEFVGVDNLLNGVVTACGEGMVTVVVDGREVEAVSDCVKDTKVSVGIRPEDITLSLVRTSSSARNLFEAEVSRVIVLGPLARVELCCGFPLVALVTRRSAEEMGLKPGQKVYASFKATAVNIIPHKLTA